MGSSPTLSHHSPLKEIFNRQSPLSSQDKIQLKAIISTHCLLCNLSAQQQAQCLEYSCKTQYLNGQYIYRQYDNPQSMYIIKEGSVYIEIDCSLIKSLSNKQYFGHQNICFQGTRNQSVRVMSNKVLLYSINKQKICSLIKENMKQHLQNIREMFSKIHFFNYLTNNERKVLIDNTRKFIFKEGQILFQKQHEANTFYIIKKGAVVIQIQGKKNIEMHEGDYFGQSAFSSLIHKGKKRQRMGRAKAKTNGVQVYAIELCQIKQNLGIYVRSIFFFNLFKWALFRDQNLQSFPSVNYHILIQFLKVRQGYKYQILAQKCSKPKYLFIPLEAEINKSKQLKLYGSKYLRRDTRQIIQQQIRLTDDGFYAYGLIEDFKMVLFKQESQLQLQELKKITLLKQPLYKSMTLNLKNISKYSKKLASSQFSTILIAQDNRFGNEFIIKIYKKKDNKHKTALQKHKSQNQLQIYHKKKTFKILQNCNQSSQAQQIDSIKKQGNKQQKDIISITAIQKQRQIARLLCSHFFSGYYKSQQDCYNYYLYYEFVKGISLEDLITTFGYLPNKMVKFYLASLATALNYFHSQRIVYRNLHPSDIIIKHNGNITLIDYSTCKILGDTGKTNTLIGVPYYMPPEIIKRQNYTYNSDLWSLGVVFYEMLTGILPFAYGQTDPSKIFQCILKDEPNYSKIKEKNAKVLVRALLQKDPSLRLTNPFQIRDFKYINDLQFEWHQFLQRKLSPVYFPNCSQQKYVTVENQDLFDANLVSDWD